MSGALSLTLLLVAGAEAPQDAACRAALARLYDGSTGLALAALEQVAAQHPDDPMPVYLQALALAWRIEQQPESRELDKELQRTVDRAIGLADARLRRAPEDLRALLARAGAHGARSRLHMFRYEKGPAAKAAVRSRADLLLALRLDPENKDAQFGLGLYDYYADVLPRVLKLVRFFMGLPGGDRERGLKRLEEARLGSLFHDGEVQAQLYVIYAFYEQDHDRALREIRALRRLYPGSPLWALQLAEHLRERLGLYAESARVAREVIAATGRHPNYSEVAGAMGRLALAEALLLDLRLPEARRAALEVKEGLKQAPSIRPRARLLLGRALELEGDREGALVHYRAAAAGTDKELRGRAQRALREPASQKALRALHLVAEARRAREAGRLEECADAARQALEHDPDSAEARLYVAEAELEAGRATAAQKALEKLASRERTEPPWVLPWARLLLAQALEQLGERAAALHQYKKVYEEPLGREELQGAAALALRRAKEASPDAPPQSKHSK